MEREIFSLFSKHFFLVSLLKRSGGVAAMLSYSPLGCSGRGQHHFLPFFLSFPFSLQLLSSGSVGSACSNLYFPFGY